MTRKLLLALVGFSAAMTVTTSALAAAGTGDSSSPILEDSPPSDYYQGYHDGIFSGFPDTPPIFPFNTSLPGGGYIYGDGGILPWDFGYGVSPNGLALDTGGTDQGLVGLIDYNPSGPFEISNVETYGNYVWPAGSTEPEYYCLICNQFSIELPGMNSPIVSSLNIFTNGLPQLEIDTPWGDIGSGNFISDAPAALTLLNDTVPAGDSIPDIWPDTDWADIPFSPDFVGDFTP
jgi:hypothetical protein